MPETHLLQLLAEDEREHLLFRHEEWDDLALGRLSMEEAVARARARGALNEEEISLACALFTPPGRDYDDKLAEQIFERIEESRAKTSASIEPQQEDLTTAATRRRVP